MTIEKAPQAAAHESCINLDDYERLARTHLESTAYDYFAGASWDGVTLRANRTSYNDIALRPRMLVDVTVRDKTVELFGCNLSMPVVVAPMAFQGMAHPDGELATARAATSSGTVMCASTLSNFSIEEIAAEAKAGIWFQLYVYKDRELSRHLVERAKAAGCSALVLTVDTPLLGRREQDVRNRFRLPTNLRIDNLAGSNILERLPKMPADSGLAAYMAALYDPSLTWTDVDWFRSLTDLPIIIKGILRADDATRAIEHGAAGIVVSNHGGRQLDTAIATIKALPEIVDAVGGKCKILVDGGIRRGTDVLKAVALGADAVMLGRPVLWGLAAAGETGAAHVLELLQSEFDLAMALSGCPNLQSITSDLVQL